MSINRSRSTLVLLAAGVAMLAVFAATASAATLETPQTLKPEPQIIRRHFADLRGVLSPHAPGEMGATYEFVYRATETGVCKGAGETATAAGLVLGGEAEPVSQEVEEFEEQTEYAVCLVEQNQAKTQEVVGPAVSFRTGPPETPVDEEVTGITGTSATLKATLNPNHEGEPGYYGIDYQLSTSTECVDGGVKESEPIATQGHEAEEVQATVTGLSPVTTYTFCPVAFANPFVVAEGVPVTFTTRPAQPSISAASVVGVYSDEATVAAEINPAGLATGYKVEYEPGKSTPEAHLPAAAQPVSVRQHLSGLAPGSTYVAHLVASNEEGHVEAEVKFTTGAAPPREEVGSHCTNKNLVGFQPSLPDCRAVELVSPPGETGEVYDPGGDVGTHEEDINSARPFRAAAEGERVAYLADPGSGEGDGSLGKSKGNEFLATRAARGWEVSDITPPVGEGESASEERMYVSFSSDLGTGTLLSERDLRAARPEPKGPEEPCFVLYGTDLANGGSGPAYSALFTKTLTPGFCGERGAFPGDDKALAFAGEAPDHTVKLFDSPAALESPAVESSEVGGNVYASVGGDDPLDVVNELPDGAIEPHAVAGGPSELSGNGPDLDNVISPSGERVIWSSVTAEESVGGEPAAFPTGLYAREGLLSGDAHTVQLDEAVAGAPGPSGGGQFWASADGGNDVFFTDCHKLVAGSSSDEEDGCTHVGSGGTMVKTGNDLYMYDFSAEAGRRLVDLTKDADGEDPLGANVQGVIGASEDGRFVYIVAGGTLGGAPNAQGVAPEPVKCEKPHEFLERQEELAGHVPVGLGCNLFELHFNGEQWEAPRFIATVAAGDNAERYANINDPRVSETGENAGDWVPNLGSRTAEVAPNGESLVFSSTQSLTGYDVSAAGTAEGAKEGQNSNEIFLFSATADRVTCVSCDPENKPIDVADLYSGIETYVPVSSSDTFMHRWMNADGTEVFFNSSQPLVGGDVNGVQDVYEWAAEGTSSCPTSTSVYGGCVFLLSEGESESFSFLVDVDESGSNVFLTHHGPLYGVGAAGTKSALYDLRADGGQSHIAEGCDSQAACPATPAPGLAPGVPGSMAVSGSDNFGPPVLAQKAVVVAPVKKKKCVKGAKLKRGRCVKTKRPKHKRKSHKGGK